MRKVGILLLLATLTTSLLFSLSSSTSAAEADQKIGLALRPAIMELAAEPGATISSTIFVQNISQSPVSVEIGAQSLVPNDPEIDQQKRKDFDASTWLIGKGEKLLLAVGEQKSIDIQFLVPQNAGPGGHYTMVTFTTTSTQQLSSPGAVVTPALTSLALITVAGEVNEEISVEQFDAPFLVFGENQTLTFDIANTGNVHVLPTATVKIYDRTGMLIDNIIIPPQLILPNTTKQYQIGWSTGERTGIHSLEIDLSYGSPRQSETLRTGTVIFLPGLAGLLFALSVLAVFTLIIFLPLRKPLKKFFWRFKGIRFGPKSLSKKHSSSENKPQHMAKLSMDPSKLDDLLSNTDSHHKPRPPHTSKPRKKKKIIIQ